MLDFKQMDKQLVGGIHYVALNTDGVRYHLIAAEQGNEMLLTVDTPDLTAMHCRVRLPSRLLTMEAVSLVEDYLNGVDLGKDDEYTDEGEQRVGGLLVSMFRRDLGGHYYRIMVLADGPGRQLTAEMEIFDGKDERGTLCVTGRFKGFKLAKHLAAGIALQIADKKEKEGESDA